MFLTWIGNSALCRDPLEEVPRSELAVIQVAIVFLFSQRYLVRGLVTGAVKE